MDHSCFRPWSRVNRSDRCVFYPKNLKKLNPSYFRVKGSLHHNCDRRNGPASADGKREETTTVGGAGETKTHGRGTVPGRVQGVRREATVHPKGLPDPLPPAVVHRGRVRLLHPGVRAR